MTDICCFRLMDWVPEIGFFSSSYYMLGISQNSHVPLPLACTNMRNHQIWPDEEEEKPCSFSQYDTLAINSIT